MYWRELDEEVRAQLEKLPADVLEKVKEKIQAGYRLYLNPGEVEVASGCQVFGSGGYWASYMVPCGAV